MFTDHTLARLGASTIVRFKEQTRMMELSGGAMLLQVPEGAPPAKIITGVVTSDVSGTVMLKYDSDHLRFIVLQGKARLSLEGAAHGPIVLKGGQCTVARLSPPPVQLGNPREIDLKHLIETSLLIKRFASLANQDLINRELHRQSEGKASGDLTEVGMVTNQIDPVDQAAALRDTILPPDTSTPPIITGTPPVPIPTPTATPSPTATPRREAPSPNPFRPPNTIPFPNPLVITSGTIIRTDRTNPVISYLIFLFDTGKIYRGRSIDGPMSAWAFRSTSAFDIASGFDALIGDSSGAAFKFTSLQLTGNPTIDTTNGEINLGLIAVDGITSGNPGGVLTFAGISGLLLATQEGPITLGPEISFSGLHDLTIYARGSSSDLTLGSDISMTSKVRLLAERDMSITSSIATDELYAFVGRNLTINGSNYDVGGTFLAFIDGAESVTTFNNATVHADVLKVGVFGANGVLNVGGGTLSADTTLKLYAPGMNGQLNFVSDVTLGGNSAKVLAANSIGIFDNVVVTIGGTVPAVIYTNNANYTGFGGNGTTTGTFAGAGAHNPRPLSHAPPFNGWPAGNPTSGKRTRAVMNVRDSAQLLSLLDDAVPGPDRRLRIPHPRGNNHLANSRINADRMSKAARGMADIRHLGNPGVVNSHVGGGRRAF